MEEVKKVGRPTKTQEQRQKEKNDMKRRLVLQRQENLGLYSIDELAQFFGVGRKDIDDKINAGKLAWISPNGKKRFIKLEDYLETCLYTQNLAEA